jgi:TPR repeat protein
MKQNKWRIVLVCLIPVSLAAVLSIWTQGSDSPARRTRWSQADYYSLTASEIKMLETQVTENKNSDAAYRLYEYYALSLPVTEHSTVEAQKWLKAAVELGNSKAQVVLNNLQTGQIPTNDKVNDQRGVRREQPDQQSDRRQ